MSRGRIALLFLLILLALGFVSQSIVKISLVQLRVLLAREQLLNYELSSRMLRAKFKQMLLQKDDLKQEVKMKVLESSVMNFDRADQVKLSADEVVGLWVVNIVRLLNIKPLLSLEEDQNRLLLLQYAFHLERTRKYAQAAEKYTALEDEFSTGDENLAFVLLHNGFCLALSGQTGTAIEKLEEVEEDYRGTHYQENATILISILREGLTRQEDILKRFKTEIERARALYSNGQYAAALASFQKAKRLTYNDRYQRARSYEEVGQSRKAIDEYMKLANSGGGQVAKQANRRLLVIGEVYDGGDKIKKYAEDKAKKLGDTAILNEVKEVAALKKEPEVVAKIQKKLKEDPGSIDAETLEQLQDIKEELETTLAAEEKQVASIVEKQETREDDAAREKARKERERLARRAAAANRLLAARTGKKHLRLRADLIDGRQVRGFVINRVGKDPEQFAEIKERFSVRVPLGDIKSISLDNPGERALVMITPDSGKILFGNRLEQQTMTVGDSPEELEERSFLYLFKNGQRQTLEGKVTISSVIPANPALPLLVEWKGNKKSYGTDVAFRGERLIAYSAKHRLELEREKLIRVELIGRARAGLELEIRLQGGARVVGQGVKAGWRGMRVLPGGRVFPWARVRDLLPVPK